MGATRYSPEMREPHPRHRVADVEDSAPAGERLDEDAFRRFQASSEGPASVRTPPPRPSFRERRPRRSDATSISAARAPNTASPRAEQREKDTATYSGLFGRGEIYDAKSLRAQKEREAKEVGKAKATEKARTPEDCEREAKEAALLQAQRAQQQLADAAAAAGSRSSRR